MIYVWITLFILAVMVFWVTNLFGLPGNWMIILIAAVWIWLGPSQEPYEADWTILVVLVVLASVGEVIEFGASIVGTKGLGGSKKGATASLVGSILGGIVGAVFGLPIPVVGWIIGSVLFACIGALVGATLVEKLSGKPMKSSLKIGGAAFVGRMLGTVGKITLGSVMAIVAIVSLFF